MFARHGMHIFIFCVYCHLIYCSTRDLMAHIVLRTMCSLAWLLSCGMEDQQLKTDTDIHRSDQILYYSEVLKGVDKVPILKAYKILVHVRQIFVDIFVSVSHITGMLINDYFMTLL